MLLSVLLIFITTGYTVLSLPTTHPHHYRLHGVITTGYTLSSLLATQRGWVRNRREAVPVSPQKHQTNANQNWEDERARRSTEVNYTIRDQGDWGSATKRRNVLVPFFTFGFSKLVPGLPDSPQWAIAQ